MLPETMLAPAFALIVWTFVMLLWLYAARIPAMLKLKIDPQESARTGTKPNLPAAVNRPADNYNHLHEQPTLFYALCVIHTMVAAETDQIALYAAWAYVGIRIVHSLVQATVNIIMVRFMLFNLGSIALGVVAWRTGAWLLAL
jgi:hypothetical protein